MQLGVCGLPKGMNEKVLHMTNKIRIFEAIASAPSSTSLICNVREESRPCPVRCNRDVSELAGLCLARIACPICEARSQRELDVFSNQPEEGTIQVALLNWMYSGSLGARLSLDQQAANWTIHAVHLHEQPYQVSQPAVTPSLEQSTDGLWKLDAWPVLISRRHKACRLRLPMAYATHCASLAFSLCSSCTVKLRSAEPAVAR